MSTLITETFKIFVAAKSLRYLSLRALGSITQSINDILIHVSDNLTTLLVHDVVNVSAAWSMLSHLHRLERCHLNIFDNQRSSWSTSSMHVAGPIPRFSSDPIVLPVLNTLSINSTLTDIESFCEILEIRSLSALHLHILPDGNTRPPLHWGMSSSMATSNALLNYAPDSTQKLCAFFAQCTSLRSLAIAPHHLQAAEMQSIFNAVPQVEHLTFYATQTARVGSQVQVPFHSSPFLGMAKHLLDPLLKQQWVLSDTGSSNGESIIHLDTPLLPCLQSLEWYHSSETIPNDQFVAFINNRLFQSPRRISTGRPAAASGISDLEIPQQAPTTPLRSIKIRARSISDVHDIESGIIRHAESEGLTRGVNFQLDVALCPSVAPQLPGRPRYVIPPGFSRPEPVHISEDNLNIERDATWPWVEF